MPILTPSERLGQIVAERYRLDAVLSSGGMGVLYRAFDPVTQCDVAVKMLKPSHALDADRVARFVRETRIASLVEHPNIARALDVWADADAAPVLVMELLEGQTLAQKLAQRGALSLDDALAIALPIMRALEAVHARGIVHRDLKPSNIFLARGPGAAAITPKLLDFGIAKSPEDVFDTQTGVLVGTPGYIAPEQAQNGEASNLTEVWGMAAVLYRCLAGRPPHSGSSAAELLGKLLREPAPPLRAAGVSKRACATIDRALARSPERRYASIGLFARALAEFTAGETGTDTQARPVGVRGGAAIALSRAQPMFFGACALSASLAFAPASAGSTAATAGAALAQREVQVSAGVSPMRPAQVAPDDDEDGQRSDPTRQVSPPELTSIAPAVTRERESSTSESERRADAPDPVRPAASVPPKRIRNAPTSPLTAAGPAATAAQRLIAAQPATPPASPLTAASPASIVEHEATTGLPVATEW
jgi:hypothetical protein